MNKKIRMLCFASAVVAAACASQAVDVIYSNDFESLTAGNLAGQGSWRKSLDSSPVVTTGTGINTSQVIGNSTVASGSVGAKETVPGIGETLAKGATTGAFTIDFYRENACPKFLGASIGKAGNFGHGVGLYQESNVLHFREAVDHGKDILLTKVDGTSFGTANKAWYRVTYNLDFVKNQITSVFAENLTTPGPATQLYFGAGNATYTYADEESTWDKVVIRSGVSTNNIAYLDNISLTATLTN